MASYQALVRYDRVVNGVVANTWFSTFAGPEYREASWGDPQTYTIISTILPQSQDPAWVAFRGQRNSLLTDSDWTQLPDAVLGETTSQQWATYRQQLRDLPSVTQDPTLPAWPLPPNAGMINGEI